MTRRASFVFLSSLTGSNLFHDHGLYFLSGFRLKNKRNFMKIRVPQSRRFDFKNGYCGGALGGRAGSRFWCVFYCVKFPIGKLPDAKLTKNGRILSSSSALHYGRSRKASFLAPASIHIKQSRIPVFAIDCANLRQLCFWHLFLSHIQVYLGWWSTYECAYK